jgi:membrane-associated phospholipid phosphatase
MTVFLIVLACGIAAAIAAFAASWSPSVHMDPIDPSAEERAVKRSLRHHPKVRRFLRQRMDRSTAGGFMLTAAFVITFAAASALGLLLALIDHNEWMREIDDEVAEWGSEHATSQAVDIIKLITNLGSTWFVVTALVAVAVFDYVRRRNAQVFLFVAVVGLGELALNNLIKVLVQRDRPAVLQLMSAHGYSFPSGHSAAAAAAWSAVALVLGRDRSRRTRALLAGGAALIAITVATSRALLGVHWVSDVLGGLAMGWGWFLLVAVVFGGRAQQLGDPLDAGAGSGQDLTARDRVDA